MAASDYAPRQSCSFLLPRRGRPQLGNGDAGELVAHPQRGEMRSPVDCADHVAAEAIEKDVPEPRVASRW
jgi:hypothetical protein